MSYFNQADWFFNPTEEQKAEDIADRAMVDKMAQDPDLQASPEATNTGVVPPATTQAVSTPPTETVTVTETVSSGMDPWKMAVIGLVGVLVWLKFFRTPSVVSGKRKRRR